MKLRKLAALVLAGALCVTTFVGCGVNPAKVAATLGEQEVSAGVVNFVCKFQKASLDDMYAAYFGGTDFWSQDLYGNGSTMEETVKDSVMDSLHDLYTLKAHMADYNVEITADEEAAIKKAAEAFIASNSKDALDEMSATEEIVIEVLTLYTIQAKMYDAMIVDTDRNVSDEEANMRGITLVSIGIAGGYNESGTYEEYTDAEVTAIKATADKILTESSSVGLETAAKNNNYTAEDTAYNKNDDSMDETLLAALNALQVGETSKVIETTSALYIATIDEEVDAEATEENREAIITERENQVYSDKLDEWQKEDGWKVDESVVEKIDFHNTLTQQDPNAKDTETTTEKGTEEADSTEAVEATEK